MKDLSHILLEYLQHHSSADLVGLGTLYKKQVGAQMSTDGVTLLPPSFQLFLTFDAENKGENFAMYCAKIKSISMEDAMKGLRNQFSSWKENALQNGFYSIEGIGEIINDGGEVFLKGISFSDEVPDFYGLEKVNLKDINDSSSTHYFKTKAESRWNKAILWTFLVIVPIGGMIYFAYNQKDQPLGKKILDSLPIEIKLP